MMNFSKHKLFKSRYFKVALFLLVFIFTFVLRAHNYEKTPATGNLEEMLYAWSGIYLVETGVPVSWSTLAYPARAEVFRGVIYSSNQQKPSAGVTLYKPWLDEPPVFSYLVGFFAHSFGANRNEMIQPAFIRFPVVLISTATSILIFLVAFLLFDFTIGLLAMLIYGITPIFVFGSRLAVPENLIAFLLMLLMLLIIKLIETRKIKYLIPLPFLVGIAGLSKPTGFLLTPLVIYFLLQNKFKQSIIYFVLVVLVFVGGFIYYGLSYDPEIFWKITSIQSFRPVGFSSLAWFFISPSYDWRITIDSWYVFCLLSAVFFIFKVESKNLKFLATCLIFWIGVVMISGGEGDLLAWYRYPAFPLLSIFGALGIRYLIQNPNIFTSFFASGMLLGNSHLLVNSFHPNISPLAYRLTLSGLMLPSVIQSLFKKPYLDRLVKLVIILIIIAGIFFNIKYIYNEYEILCAGSDCLYGPSTFLSRLHFPLIWRLIAY